MAPHWTGVNYGAKGFAKAICHDESSGRQRTLFVFLNYFWKWMIPYKEKRK